MKKYFCLLAVLLIVAFACKKDKNESGTIEFSVKGFWPNGGNEGTIVTINGKGFAGKMEDNEVSFNGTAATVVSKNDSQLVVQAPLKGSTGVLSVTVKNKKVEAGTYTYQQLTLRNVSPLNGPAGTNIRISGEGFGNTGAPAKVVMNGKEAIVTNVTDTLLVVAVPEGAGSGKIKVMVNGKEVTGPDFIFQHINGIKPLKGGAGTEVIIQGEGFSSVIAENQISFNGKPATVVSASGNQLVVKAPESVATGPVSVLINGQKTIGAVFTVVPKPLLKTVTPLSAPEGKDIAITGDYFSNQSDEIKVTFNGHVSTLVNNTEKQLTAKVPAGAGSGNIVITVNGQTTAGPVFKEQNLGINGLLPDNGLAGTEVSISGMGFSNLAADNQVFFNGVPASVVSATETELKVKAPAGLSSGAVTVKSGGLDATGPLFRRAGVITLAGGPSSAAFSYPDGIAVDAAGNVFVSDGHLIKKINPSGMVSNYAGDAAPGTTDGAASDARFNFITQMTTDAHDNLFVIDFLNKRIRKITSSGIVSTYSILNFSPTGIGVDRNNVVYVGAQYGAIYKLDAFGNPTKASNTGESATGPMVIDDAGAVYYTGDYSYNGIFRTKTGGRDVFAGSAFTYGAADGPYQSALFGTPTGVVIDAGSGSMYTTDQNALRRMADGQVTTITGWKGTMIPGVGYQDGTLIEARFSGLKSLCIDREGNVYVVDRNNKAVRKIIMQ